MVIWINPMSLPDAVVLGMAKVIRRVPAAPAPRLYLAGELLRQGNADGAITAFEQYVRIMPQEPNPQDSLGEALLAANLAGGAVSALDTDTWSHS